MLPWRGSQAIAVPHQHGTRIYAWPVTVADDYRRARHLVSALHAHLVFVTKYQRGVLTSEHIHYLNTVFRKVGSDFGAVLARYNGDDDHMYLLAGYPPKVAIAALVSSLNRVSARILRQRHGSMLTATTCVSPPISLPHEGLRRCRSSGTTLSSSGHAAASLNAGACAAEFRSTALPLDGARAAIAAHDHQPAGWHRHGCGGSAL